jgi:hypothetical protein
MIRHREDVRRGLEILAGILDGAREPVAHIV